MKEKILENNLKCLVYNLNYSLNVDTVRKICGHVSVIICNLYITQ